MKYYGGKYDKLPQILHYIELVAQENNATTFLECFGGGGKCISIISRKRYTMS